MFSNLTVKMPPCKRIVTRTNAIMLSVPENLALPIESSVALALSGESEPEIAAIQPKDATPLNLSEIAPEFSSLHINSIPIDCLILILSRLSLQDLIPLCRICTHWRLAIEKHCAGKQCLTIKIFANHWNTEVQSQLALSYGNVDYYKRIAVRLETACNQEDCIMIEERNFILNFILNRHSSKSMSKILPNVKRLVVYFSLKHSIKYVQSLCYLLSLWTGVESICLRDCTRMDPNDSWLVHELLRVINENYNSLKRLDLYWNFDWSSEKTIVLPSFDLNRVVSGILEQFSLSGPIVINLFDFLNQSASDKLSALTFECEDINTEMQLAQLYRFAFVSNVTKLKLNSVRSKVLIKLVCERFHNLTSLAISAFPDAQLRLFSDSCTDLIEFNCDLLDELRKLTTLTDLELHNMKINLDYLEAVPIGKVTKFSFCNFQSNNFESFDLGLFKDSLDFVFPNVRECNLMHASS